MWCVNLQKSKSARVVWIQLHSAFGLFVIFSPNVSARLLWFKETQKHWLDIVPDYCLLCFGFISLNFWHKIISISASMKGCECTAEVSLSKSNFENPQTTQEVSSHRIIIFKCADGQVLNKSWYTDLVIITPWWSGPPKGLSGTVAAVCDNGAHIMVQYDLRTVQLATIPKFTSSLWR